MTLHKVHILEAGGRLAPHTELINSTVEKSLASISEKLILASIDINITDEPRSVTPEIGLGSHVGDKNQLYIYADPGRDKFEEIISRELPSALARELYRCARAQAMGHDKTFLEALVSEGLAEHFNMEINRVPPAPWAVAIKGEELSELRARASLEFDSDTYDYTAWFYGSRQYGIPRWAGYSIGFELVRAYIGRTDKRAFELTGASAKIFVS